MLGKYALFFALAFVAVQGSSIGFQSVENFKDNEIYGIWDAIQEIIEKIKEAIASGNIGEILHELEAKIREIIENLNLSEVIEKIISKIKEIIGGISGIGESALACIEEQRPAIEQLAQEIRSSSMACVQEAKDKLTVIREQITALNEKANALRQDVLNRGLKCIRDNIMDPVNVLPCFKEQVPIINEEVNQLKEQVMATAQLVKDLATEVRTSLVACMSEVSQVANAKQQEIVTAIQTCISAQ